MVELKSPVVESDQHDAAVRDLHQQDASASVVKPEASTFRMALPQVLACSVKNLLLIDLGMAVAFSTIVIPVLRGLQHDRNPDEILHFTKEQSSWFGSLVFLTQPIGAVSSGWITEAIGRKKAMLLVNLPHIIAWTMLYFTTEVYEIFIAGILLGLGMGLMEAPILTYVGEISHPSIRGMLLAFSHVTVIAGSCLMYLIGSLTTWRNAALICLTVPCLTVVALWFVPETPHWLIAHNRSDDALESLQWLRGWVTPAAVSQEFAELKDYIRASTTCPACVRNGLECTHRPQFVDQVRELMRSYVLKPFVLVLLCFIIVQSNGIAAIKPFLVQVFEIFGVPMDPNWASVVVGTMDFFANIVCVLSVRVLGKRVLCLMAVFASGVCCFVLSINAYLTIPAGLNSFNPDDLKLIAHDNYLALGVFVCLAFFAGVAHSVAWMLVSEVFPVRVRGIVSGFAAATGYFVVFVATKTYFVLEQSCSVWGAFLLYAVLTTVGLIVQFVILPDTEGHTLEEIETYFSDKTRRIGDTRILRTTAGNGDAPLVPVGGHQQQTVDLESNSVDETEKSLRRRDHRKSDGHSADDDDEAANGRETNGEFK